MHDLCSCGNSSNKGRPRPRPHCVRIEYMGVAVRVCGMVSYYYIHILITHSANTIIELIPYEYQCPHPVYAKVGQV